MPEERDPGEGWEDVDEDMFGECDENLEEGMVF